MGLLHGKVVPCCTIRKPYTAALVERVPEVHGLET